MYWRLTNVRDVPRRHRGVRIELRNQSHRKGKPHECSFYAWNRLGKNTFLVHGVDAEGAVTVRRTITRAKLGELVARLPPCLIGMEACSGAHHIGRRLTALGHDVRLIPAQYVKP